MSVLVLVSCLCVAAAQPPSPTPIAPPTSRPAPQPVDATLPLLTIKADDTVIKQSCRLRFADNLVIADANENGVIQIGASDITVEFVSASPLRGAGPRVPPDRFEGYGVRVDGQSNVTIRGLNVEGYRCGLWATNAPGLTVERCDFSNNFHQRLRSGVQAEDSGDWLWPHKNDGQEWRKTYGAGACIENSTGVTVRNCRARRGQNGLILDRVNDSRVFDNDFSFLSGWGVAMWRSSRNIVARNALDFCIRGYSHGFYNRGQDSAGILMFEQCSDNVVAENSATHCGDGFFGFAGKEALGEVEKAGFEHKGAGCNRNVLIGNDFSDAAAHGIEMTFSFDNRILNNRLAGNGICGVWGGYSRRMEIAGNAIEANGLATSGSAAEGGGINIEHGSGNRIIANTFERNSRGVVLWWDEDAGLAKLPWAAANGVESGDNVISLNTFSNDAVALHLRKTPRTELVGNMIMGGQPLDADAESATEPRDAPAANPDLPVEPKWIAPKLALPGKLKPVGALSSLAGREKIVMTPWGPWDHETTLLRQTSKSGRQHVYEIFKPGDGMKLKLEPPGPPTLQMGPPEREGGPGIARVTVPSGLQGVFPYRLLVDSGGRRQEINGTLANVIWTVTFFPWTSDPRTPAGLAEWRKESRREKGAVLETNGLAFTFGNNGPSQLGFSEVLKKADLPKDRFGMVATARLPLPDGRWRVTTLSDDGVRVSVGDGVSVAGAGGVGAPRVVLENWTHHGPTQDVAEFGSTGREVGGVLVTVEYFELDGNAVVKFEIEGVEGP